ncbi:Cj0814 family flagellar-dependent secreted protein, partial [Campylobacter sp. BCW_6463]|uniref:Cj0814 family flagellar-dependent secreted protein n=1 Tax=Campylobacter sp. BCW_6463 TaxID=1903580 RepID=UPI000A41D95B
FSINDNSNYNSILSQAKANKESKENSKISFANAFLKQNASKLNEIQNANSQTLARSEVLNSTNTTNTSNNTNFSISSKTNSPNYDISSEFKNSIYTLKYKQADISNTSTNTAYGYSVDKDGYMGSDFNKAAGLPEDFKIHKSTLDEIYNFNEAQYQDIKEQLGISRYFTNIDMADTIKQYYNQFNQIVNHTFNDTNKTSFTEADINSMPKGYISVGYKGLDFSDQSNPYNALGLVNHSNTKVTNVFKTDDEFHEAQAIQMGMMGIDFYPQKLNISTQSLSQGALMEGGFNPDMSVYPQNEDGSYSKEALFMSFLKSEGGYMVAGKNTTIAPQAMNYNLNVAKQSIPKYSNVDFDDIMTGKVDFASLLKGYAQDGWLDAGIYAMEKGVAWQNTSIGYGGAWFDNQLNQAKANGWKASSESINSYVGSIMDRLNNLIGQTRV